MNQENQQQPAVRRYKAFVSAAGTTQLHLRNPFVIAWWSAAFPGLGHLLLSKYLRGYILFIWEVIINMEANINLAILYSFTGRFDMARDVLDKEWALLYIPTYLFAIWDSYRTACDVNHCYMLAQREDAEIKAFAISAFEFNYLDKRSPLAAGVWSLLMPGTGQLYIHRIPTSIFLLTWWIATVYLTKLLPGVHYTLLGQFQQAKQVMDPHWLLNIPSIFFFSFYDAYANTVENNRLFEEEQSRFLKKEYQNNSFKMPSKRQSERGDSMYVVSTFEHTKYLELAITAVQMKGIAKENILAVSLDKRAEERKLFDSIHHSDGLSLLDLPLILATVFTLLGAIYGFVLEWGPLLWGLIGMAAGIVLGLAIKLVMTAKHMEGRQKNRKATEVVVIIECKENQLEMVKDTLWQHFALGVRKLDLEHNA